MKNITGDLEELNVLINNLVSAFRKYTICTQEKEIRKFISQNAGCTKECIIKQGYDEVEVVRVLKKLQNDGHLLVQNKGKLYLSRFGWTYLEAESMIMEYGKANK